MHDDLLTQAEWLASVDAKRPKQANLRRAISSAYYAVFHFLVHESCCRFFGTQHSQAPYRFVLGRSFVHSAMKRACASFGGGTLRDQIIRGLPRDPAGKYPIPIATREIARIFAELQGKRHLADYDRNERFKRSEVLRLIDQTRECVARFAALPETDDKRFFLACLLAWQELEKR